MDKYTTLRAWTVHHTIFYWCELLLNLCRSLLLFTHGNFGASFVTEPSLRDRHSAAWLRYKTRAEIAVFEQKP